MAFKARDEYARRASPDPTASTTLFEKAPTEKG